MSKEVPLSVNQPDVREQRNKFENKRVRLMHASDFKEYFSVEKSDELIEITGALYKELQERHGILVPVELVKHETDENLIYIVTDEITGENLSEKKGFDDKELSMVEQLYISLIAYLESKYKEVIANYHKSNGD